MTKDSKKRTSTLTKYISKMGAEAFALMVEKSMKGRETVTAVTSIGASSSTLEALGAAFIDPKCEWYVDMKMVRAMLAEGRPLSYKQSKGLGEGYESIVVGCTMVTHRKIAEKT